MNILQKELIVTCMYTFFPERYVSLSLQFLFTHSCFQTIVNRLKSVVYSTGGFLKPYETSTYAPALNYLLRPVQAEIVPHLLTLLLSHNCDKHSVTPALLV